MPNINLTWREILAIAGLAVAGVWFLKHEYETGAINPASDQNLAFKASTSLYDDLTGSQQSPGADFYDWTHPQDPYTVNTQYVGPQTGFDTWYKKDTNIFGIGALSPAK